MEIGMSAIGISLLLLAAMLGVRMRRGLQQATTFASSGGHESDMSTALAPEAVDKMLELKAQKTKCHEESLQSSGHATDRGNFRTCGLWQHSFRNARHLTLC